MWEDFVPTYKHILYVLKNFAFSPYRLTCFLQVEWCEVELLVSYLLKSNSVVVQDGFAIKNNYAHRM
jgi:hypothetical protein